MCSGSPSQPAAQAIPATVAADPPPAADPPAQLPDSGVQDAGTDQRNKAAMAYGAGNTILTSPQGLTEKSNTTNNTGKTLLGS